MQYSLFRTTPPGPGTVEESPFLTSSFNRHSARTRKQNLHKYTTQKWNNNPLKYNPVKNWWRSGQIGNARRSTLLYRNKSRVFILGRLSLVELSSKYLRPPCVFSLITGSFSNAIARQFQIGGTTSANPSCLWRKTRSRRRVCGLDVWSVAEVQNKQIHPFYRKARRPRGRVCQLMRNPQSGGWAIIPSSPAKTVTIGSKNGPCVGAQAGLAGYEPDCHQGRVLQIVSAFRQSKRARRQPWNSSNARAHVPHLCVALIQRNYRQSDRMPNLAIPSNVPEIFWHVDKLVWPNTGSNYSFLLRTCIWPTLSNQRELYQRQNHESPNPRESSGLVWVAM